jgi:thioredoxin reductase
VGAIAVTLGELEERRDIPALLENFESPQVPGLFLAGEVTGFALVRTAIAHGSAVADEVARRLNGTRAAEGVLDLCIVGAGPAGLACSLEAKRQGLTFATFEQEALGGAVASYPRRKLVMTQPVALPLHGELSRTSYQKEELIELWEGIAARERLPIHAGERLVELAHTPEGHFRVTTTGRAVVARNVCLALGRRGTPRKLSVPGEELAKVAYSLLDAQSYRGRRILVVGGGDSAVEAALGLAEQPGNEVTLSYRKAAFARIKARNELQLLRALETQSLRVLYESDVRSIAPDHVLLEVGPSDAREPLRLDNDEVFVFAGGIPPFELLEAAGVSFDPRDRPRVEPLAERGTGLVPALACALLLGLGALAFAAYHHGYYGAPPAERSASDLHGLLRPAGALGLAFGSAAVALILTNLAYLLRRSLRFPLRLGSLQVWMTAHLVTGLAALFATLLHAGLAPRDSLGGHAAIALLVLVVSGAIGRYFYAFVPRAANGRELALEDVRLELAGLSSGWERTNRDWGDRVRRRIDHLIASGHWEGGFLARLGSLLSSQRRMRRVLAELRAEGALAGVPGAQLDELEALARRAHRTALMASHFEELRGLLGSWRYLHRWVALLMVLLVAAHVVAALRYASFGGGNG